MLYNPNAFNRFQSNLVRGKYFAQIWGGGEIGHEIVIKDIRKQKRTLTVVKYDLCLKRVYGTGTANLSPV